LVLQSDYYNTNGMLNFENGQYGIADTKSKIQVALKVQQDSSLVYEASIPLLYILGSDMKPAYGSQNFSVGICINEIAYPSYHQNNSGYGHSSYGGMHTGMHRNYGSGQSTNAKPEENWYPFRLAFKNQHTGN
jgi:hypothetical protein